MPIPLTDLEGINPTSVIELFQLQLVAALHGTNTIYYFHNGASTNEAAQLQFDSQPYWRLPIEAEGFEYKGGESGSLPRPSLKVSNLFGTITSILLTVNETTVGNDLTGAKLTRIRTLARFIDYTNFGSDDYLEGADSSLMLFENEDTLQMEEASNPSNADATQQFPQEIYYIDRKVMESRTMVEFELASAFDLAGVRVPKRQCLPADFPGIGTFYTS